MWTCRITISKALLDQYPLPLPLHNPRTRFNFSSAIISPARTPAWISGFRFSRFMIWLTHDGLPPIRSAGSLINNRSMRSIVVLMVDAG